MWPFGSRKRSSVAAGSTRRWHDAWKALENDPEPDEARRYDRLRRCIVWYCTDELGEDPYSWVDGSVDASDGASTHIVEIRRLFLEVLQNQPGQGPELQARFASLTGRE